MAQALCENLSRVIITPSAAASNPSSEYDSYSYSGYDSSSYFTSGTYSGSESGSYAPSGVASEGRGTAPGYMDPQYAFRGFYSQTFSAGGRGGQEGGTPAANGRGEGDGGSTEPRAARPAVPIGPGKDTI